MNILSIITLLGIILFLNTKQIFAQDSVTVKQTDTAKFQITSDSISNLNNEIIELNQQKDRLSEKVKELVLLADITEEKKKELRDSTNALAEINKKEEEKRDLLNKQIELLNQETKKIDSTKKIYEQAIITLRKDSANLDSARKNFQKEIDEKRATIALQKDSMQVVAEVKMRDSVAITIPNQTRSYYTRVLEMHIKAKEGIIMEIIVKTDSGIFRNKSAVIDLLHFGARGGDRLYLESTKFRKKTDTIPYILLAGAIQYIPHQSYSNMPYAEFNITLLPTEAGKSFLIKESTSLNSYFNIAAFTDIKGISGEPNGIAQFTGEGKFITQTRNILNSAVIPMNYVSFQGGFSKFDNDFKGTPLVNDDSASRRDLLQRSNYSVGLKLNLIRWFTSPLPFHLFEDIQINVGFNFLGAKVYDTSYKDLAKTVLDTAFRNITQNQVYLEPVATLSRHRNFSMKVSLPVYLNSLKRSSFIRNAGLETWICPSLILMYYSKRDAGSKLFFRYNHFINLGESREAFSQIQLGYSVNLTDVWGGSK